MNSLTNKNSATSMDKSLFSIENFSHYMSVAETLSKSTLVPKGMIGKPADILIAMEYGVQLGIPYMQALQDIAVINGRPCLCLLYTSFHFFSLLKYIYIAK